MVARFKGALKLQQVIMTHNIGLVTGSGTLYCLHMHVVIDNMPFLTADSHRLLQTLKTEESTCKTKQILKGNVVKGNLIARKEKGFK